MTTQAFLLYAGRADKEYHLFFRLDSLEENGKAEVLKEPSRTKYYKKKLFDFSRIGAIYPVEFEGTTVSYKTKQAPITLWANPEEIVSWKALSIAIEAEGKELKSIGENQLEKALKPIALAYKVASYQEQRIILAEVIRIITSKKF